MSKLSAVLFDFDGTLTLPGSLDFGVIRQAVNCPPAMPIIEYIDGLASAEEAKRCMDILARFETEAARCSRPNEGAEELVASLRGRGILAGIISRNSRQSIALALANFAGLRPAHFAVILTREDVRRQKPHPDGVLLAAQRMGVPPAELLVVGDYVFDIQAGQKAGALTAFLVSAATTRKPEPPADYTVESLRELRDIITTLRGEGGGG